MNQFVVETFIKNGHIELEDIPFKDNMHVKVILIPKAELSQMSFPQIWKTTQGVQGNLADDVVCERDCVPTLERGNEAKCQVKFAKIIIKR